MSEFQHQMSEAELRALRTCARVVVQSRLDDAAGKQWRWACACGQAGEWGTESDLALPGARAHRDSA